ncbi:MAG TPA: hypothetical protein PLA50_08600 [Bacteroidia bacterium]|nr:hypothetical protein [Bacteroidia bacterium]
MDDPNEEMNVGRTKGRRRRMWRVPVFGAFLLALVVVIDDFVSKPSLTDFDPARMGELEGAMWRSYYEHRWLALARHGLSVSCGQYGFSFWDGLRSSALAARAARHFRSDTEDLRCLPLLERYYRIIAGSLGREFDVSAAARLELAWWRERRLKIGPEDYAATIAENVAVVYGLPSERLLPFARLRALAMDYRDRHGRGGGMTDEHWAEVVRQLTAAYEALSQTVSDAGR